MSIAIALVLYNPTKNTYKRLADISGADTSTFLYDNSETEAIEYLELENVFYSSCCNNIGLSKGMNISFKKADEAGHEWVMFFDQDTVFDGTTIEFVNRFIEDRRAELAEFLCVQFADDLDLNDCYHDIEHRQLIINSGTLFNLKKLKSIGWMNEMYFVDLIDYEVCYRAKLNGWKVGRVQNTPALNHKVEQDDSLYSIFGKRIIGRAYSGKRVLDYCNNSLRLIWSSIKTADIKFANIIVRNLLIYIGSQVYFRVATPSNKSGM